MSKRYGGRGKAAAVVLKINGRRDNIGYKAIQGSTWHYKRVREVQGNTGQGTAAQSSTEQYKTIQCSTGRYRAIHGSTGQFKRVRAVQGNTWQYRAVHVSTGQHRSVHGSCRGSDAEFSKGGGGGGGGGTV
jgi:hypothetical protein